MRSGQAEVAREAMERLSATTRRGLGLGDRPGGALPSAAERRREAERWYTEAVERLGRTRLRPELARAHLLYGEWLRREDRRADARHQLRTAHDLFAAMGAEAFAERARRELLATARRSASARSTPSTSSPRRRSTSPGWLETDTRNPEIAAKLFISARTVEWHLRKVFTKLGIASRKDLENALTTQWSPS